MQVVSGATMLRKAGGPVWRTNPRVPGVVPEGRRGLDREATWGKSPSDGWVYGHGSFCVVSHDACVLGAFQSMRHSAHAATRPGLETGHLRGVVTTVILAGKADDQDLGAEFQRPRRMPLLPTPRKHPDQGPARRGCATS